MKEQVKAMLIRIEAGLCALCGEKLEPNTPRHLASNAVCLECKLPEEEVKDGTSTL